jgi:hypothetical protein
MGVVDLLLVVDVVQMVNVVLHGELVVQQRTIVSRVVCLTPRFMVSMHQQQVHLLIVN